MEDAIRYPSYARSLHFHPCLVSTILTMCFFANEAIARFGVSAQRYYLYCPRLLMGQGASLPVRSPQYHLFLQPHHPGSPSLVSLPSVVMQLFVPPAPPPAPSLSPEQEHLRSHDLERSSEAFESPMRAFGSTSISQKPRNLPAAQCNSLSMATHANCV